MSKISVHTIYKIVDGTRVPGVTTIIGILNKPALLKWAWQCGIDGIDYTKARDSAADAGTLAHAMILAHLKGETLDTSEYSQEIITLAENSLSSYLKWEGQHRLEPLIIEQPLVHETLHYGGTFDFYGNIDGTSCLMDFKTGKGLYPEYEYQLAAYAHLLPELPKSYRLLRIGRDASDNYEEKVFAYIDKQWEMFQHCLAIYNLQKDMARAG